MCNLLRPEFQDETAARKWLETELWPEGPVCPKCGCVNRATQLNGKAHRAGVYQCNASECREQFTVTVGTLYERSKVPLHKWLAVTHLMMASKKGMSALQISRMIGLSYKTTWFLCHRIRESLRDGDTLPPMGGAEDVVEADETYIGGKAKNRAFREPAPKKAVLSLVQREGKVRSFHIPAVTAENVKPIVFANIDKASSFMTDESPLYSGMGKSFGYHGTVNHSAEEYARMGGYIHCNTAESFFSIVKRGITGSFHHVSETHLHRYMCEFDYRWNTRHMTDAERMTKSIGGIVGKRLTYRRIGETKNQEARQ